MAKYWQRAKNLMTRWVEKRVEGQAPLSGLCEQQLNHIYQILTHPHALADGAISLLGIYPPRMYSCTGEMICLGTIQHSPVYQDDQKQCHHEQPVKHLHNKSLCNLQKRVRQLRRLRGSIG